PIVEELGLPREEMPSQLRRNTLRFMLTGSTFPVKGNLESILAMLHTARTRETEADVLLVIRETFAGTEPPDIGAAYWALAYAKFTAEEKADAVQTLAARVPWANVLLDTVEKKDIPRADVSVATARQILALNDQALSTRLETVWGKITPASKEREALMKKWK